MYADLARTVLLGGDEERLDEEIRRIVEKHPDADRYEIADRLVSRAPWSRCAAVGAIASIPAGVLAGLPAAADMSYQVRALHRLALGIARARRRETTAPRPRRGRRRGARARGRRPGASGQGMLAGARGGRSRAARSAPRAPRRRARGRRLGRPRGLGRRDGSRDEAFAGRAAAR